MTSAALMQIIRDDLAPFVSARKGQLRIAQDPGDVLDQLLDKPASFRVVLHWAGDKDQTDQAQAAIVDNNIEIWVIKAKGLLLNPGDLLIKPQGDQPAFLTLLDDLTARVRSNVLPDEETSRFLHYRGADPLDALQAPNLETTAFKLSFTITSAKPHVEYRNL